MSRRAITLCVVSALGGCIEVAPAQLYRDRVDESGGAPAVGVSGGGAEGGHGTGGRGEGPLPVCDGTTPEPCARVLDIETGGTFSCIFLDDDTTRCWGGNESGQLGIAAIPTSPSEPVTISDLPAFEDVDFGRNHGCGRVAGRISCWGRNTVRQLGAEGSGGPLPRDVGLEGVVDFDVSWTGSCALVGEPAQVMCWGTRLDGQGWVSLDGVASYDGPTLIAGLDGEALIDLAVGSAHACALTAEQEVWCWGNGSVGNLGNGDDADSAVPVPVVGLPPTIGELGGGSRHTCVMGAPPDFPRCWGSLPQWTGAPWYDEATLFPYWSGVGATSIHHMREVICALYEGGWVRCSGDNSYRQIPLLPPNDPDSSQMELVPDVPPVAKLAMSHQHACALTTEGAVWCWGRNTEGQLGRGFLSNGETPAPVELNP